jgi:hypothetical protein
LNYARYILPDSKKDPGRPRQKKAVVLYDHVLRTPSVAKITRRSLVRKIRDKVVDILVGVCIDAIATYLNMPG